LNGLSSDNIIEACTAVLAALNATPSERVDAFIGRGHAYRSIDPRRALEDFESALAIHPTNEFAFTGRAGVYLEKRDFDRAIADYTQAIHLTDGKVAPFFELRARGYVRKGAYDLAIADYDEAIRLQPSWSLGSSAYEGRGALYMDMGDYRRAIADFDQAIELNLEHPKFASGALSSRCMVRAIMRQFQRAIANCNEALRLSADGFEESAKRGFLHLKMGDYAAAIADYDRALARDPKHADALFGRGIARLRTGDRTGSDADVAMAQVIDAKIADRFARYGVRP
jgi:tetratricopeptide (TPR) repeat protein